VIEARIDREGLPRVAEIKHEPDGSTSRAACRLLVRDEEHVALFHPLSDRWEVGPLVIAPPSFTLAVYWADVPYNLYVWFEESGSFEGAYFNIVEPEGYRLDEGTLHYRDCILDILLEPDGSEHVLDREELGVLSARERSRVLDAMEKLRPDAPRIVEEEIRELNRRCFA
jgi:predicted RNA-binding protein associated with RNAse of E/G family